MKYSVYQMDIIPGNPKENRKKVKEWIEKEVNSNNPDTIVLPEVWSTAYTLDDIEKVADRDGEPTKSFLKEIAKNLSVNIIGGSIINKVDERFYNTALVISRSGNLVYEYNKVHLVPMLNEHHYLTGGEQVPEVFELDGIKMGLIICYDLRFPEIIRSLALEGAQVLHIIAQWPNARTNHWHHLQIARAIENQMYVVSSNRVGEYNGITFCGTSMGVNPEGVVLSEGSEKDEETLSIQIHLSKGETNKKRRTNFQKQSTTLI